MKNNIVAVGMMLVCLGMANAQGMVDFDGKKDIASGLEVATPRDVNMRESDALVPSKSKMLMKVFSLSPSGEWIEAVPQMVYDKDTGKEIPQYSFKPGTRLQYTNYCGDNIGKPYSEVLHYSYVHDKTAGHYHYEPPAPPMLFHAKTSTDSVYNPPVNDYGPVQSPVSFPAMLAGTTWYTYERLPDFATQNNHLYESVGACSWSTKMIINTIVLGLKKMPSGQNYLRYRSEETKQFHPECHYGTPYLIEMLQRIADEYRAKFADAAPIEIGHMSLPWGGRFDLQRKWGESPDENHVYHRIGVEADIRKLSVPLKNRVAFLETVCKITNKLYSEPAHDSESESFHLVASTPTTMDKDADYAVGFTICCKDGFPDAVNIKTCTGD